MDIGDISRGAIIGTLSSTGISGCLSSIGDSTTAENQLAEDTDIPQSTLTCLYDERRDLYLPGKARTTTPVWKLLWRNCAPWTTSTPARRGKWRLGCGGWYVKSSNQPRRRADEHREPRRRSREPTPERTLPEVLQQRVALCPRSTASRSSPPACRWHHRAGYPDACSRSPPVRCWRALIAVSLLAGGRPVGEVFTACSEK